MMEIIDCQPSAMLLPYIAVYRFVDTPCVMAMQKYVTDGTIKLYIHENDIYPNFYTGTGKMFFWKDGFVGHPIFGDHRIELTANLRVVICQFKPAGFYHLFKVPVSLFNDDIIHPEELLGSRYNELKDRLCHVSTREEKAQVLDDFFCKFLKATDTIFPIRSTYAQDHIIAQSGNINIYQLMAELNVSRRTLERQFLEQIGLSPKLFCRVIRFNRAFLLKHVHPAITWPQIIHYCGYYDQSHYISEFKFFTGITPKQYYDTPLLIASAHVGTLLDPTEE